MIGSLGIRTASWIELAWTIPSFIAWLFASWDGLDAVADLLYLRSAKLNGRRKIVAHSNLRVDTTIAYLSAMFTTVGCLAMTLPDPPIPWTPNRIVSIVLFLSAPWVLVYVAAMGRHDRRRLLASIHVARKERDVALADLTDSE